jgi:hypothetical protein
VHKAALEQALGDLAQQRAGLRKNQMDVGDTGRSRKAR